MLMLGSSFHEACHDGIMHYQSIAIDREAEALVDPARLTLLYIWTVVN